MLQLKETSVLVLYLGGIKLINYDRMLYISMSIALFMCFVFTLACVFGFILK